jgi:CRISPR/Cas system-associated endoribonuclease Cas2
MCPEKFWRHIQDVPQKHIQNSVYKCSVDPKFSLQTKFTPSNSLNKLSRAEIRTKYIILRHNLKFILIQTEFAQNKIQYANAVYSSRTLHVIFS